MKWIALAALTFLSIDLGAGTGQEWTPPEFKLPEKVAHPWIACTPPELARLQEAFRGSGKGHGSVAKILPALAEKSFTFPPRGGQHNQWYQCDACQRALTTVDDTHHKCPGCGKVYSGEPYDDVIFTKIHDRNLETLRKAAWAYAITGEKKYSDFAVQTLVGYAKRYSQYPYHDNGSAAGKKKPGLSGGHLYEQTLTEAQHLAQQIAPAFDLVYNALSEDDRKAIRENLIRPMLENLDKHKAGKSNWQTWHNAAMIAGGACLEDVAWIRKAIDQQGNGFVFQMKECVSDEGMWFENSWGYHFYTLQAMTAIAETARRMGSDLWSHPSLRKMFTLPVQYAMADGSLPRFGDDVNTTARSGLAQMEAAYAATKDPSILSILPADTSWDSVLLGRDVARKGDPPKLTSRLFKSAGHAILRSDGPGGLTAALTFARFGGAHGHFDKLSFVFFGFRRELGVDPGRAASQAYRLPIHKNWYRATLGHNAVLVDRVSQEAARGSVLTFAANDHYAAVVAQCDEAYKGVTHRRLLLLTPEYLLIFDDLTADKEQRFDWVYHNRGKSVECESVGQSGELKGLVGGEYVKSVRTGTTGESIRVRFEDDSVTTHLTMDAQAGTEVAIGDGPGASVTERIPMTMASRTGKRAHFCAVLEPVEKGRSPGVQSVMWSEKDGVYTITVTHGSDSDVLTLTADKLELKRGSDLVLKS